MNSDLLNLFPNPKKLNQTRSNSIASIKQALILENQSASKFVIIWLEIELVKVPLLRESECEFAFMLACLSVRLREGHIIHLSSKQQEIIILYMFCVCGPFFFFFLAEFNFSWWKNDTPYYFLRFDLNVIKEYFISRKKYIFVAFISKQRKYQKY